MNRRGFLGAISIMALAGILKGQVDHRIHQMEARLEVMLNPDDTFGETLGKVTRNDKNLDVIEWTEDTLVVAA